MTQNLSKIGLVIGNADYEKDKLGDSPLNDAKEISKILSEIGFEIVHKENIKSSEIDHIISEFTQSIKENCVALFYYAGHAIQIEGENWLLPVDNSFVDSRNAMKQSLKLTNLTDRINHKNPSNIAIILDCCRDNPYAPSWLIDEDEKANDLLEITSNGKRNILISYATSAGKKSYGSMEIEGHGRFTKHFIKFMRNTFGLKIEDILKKVSAAIEKENHIQIPCIMNYQSSDYYLDNLYSTERRTRNKDIFSIDIYENTLVAIGGGARNNNYLNIYRINPFDWVKSIQDPENKWDGECVQFSTDGKLATGCSDGTIRLWGRDNETKKPTIHTLKGHERNVFSVCFSPDGNLLASAGSDHTIKIWDIQNDSLIHTFDEIGEAIYSISFDRSGKILASASYSTIALWDLNSKKLIHKFCENVSQVVTFSPDGKLLATGGTALKLWDAKSLELVCELEKKNKKSITALKFSPNGEVLASGDFTVKLWDVATGVLLQKFDGSAQFDTVYSIGYNADGKMIFAGCNDSRIKIWSKSLAWQSHE